MIIVIDCGVILSRQKHIAVKTSKTTCGLDLVKNTIIYYVLYSRSAYCCRYPNSWRSVAKPSLREKHCEFWLSISIYVYIWVPVEKRRRCTKHVRNAAITFPRGKNVRTNNRRKTEKKRKKRINENAQAQVYTGYGYNGLRRTNTAGPTTRGENRPKTAKKKICEKRK